MINSISFRQGIITVVLLMFIFSGIAAQSEKEVIYQAFVTGDMKKWKAAMDNLAGEKSLTTERKTELVGYYYGYIGYLLAQKNKSEAQVYVDKGDVILDALISKNPGADAYALKGAFIGFKIGITPMRAPFLGKSSSENVAKAITLDAANIQANIEKGNILYYSPAAFGGDKAEAKKYYNKAVMLFENEKNGTQQNWLYLSLLTKIAQIYTNEKEYTQAKKQYEKILKIEPNYNYVENELYPQLLKKM